MMKFLLHDHKVPQMISDFDQIILLDFTNKKKIFFLSCFFLSIGSSRSNCSVINNQPTHLYIRNNNLEL